MAPAARNELLPTRYIHAVFTLPRELAPLALQIKRILYSLLFHANAEDASNKSPAIHGT